MAGTLRHAMNQQLSPEMAQALLDLLKVIDGDSATHPDWVDAVCTAREKLPPATTEVLASHAAVAIAGNTSQE